MNNVLVETTSGTVAGEQADGVVVFRGIPYAEAPVGSSRFRPPVPVRPWRGTHDATAFGPVAPQNPSVLDAVLGRPEHRQHEDCLNLNVWTLDVHGSRPVMVFIHGGAFTNGSGRSNFYEGSALASRGVVVVTINYRLGVLGFLHLADLAGAEYENSGNCGLLDQVAALTWVRDNVASFGGDPTNVTIFGESAGGCSVSSLLGLPGARGLFHRAIVQSGTAAHIRNREQANAATIELLGELEIDLTALARLPDVPVERILAAQQTLITRRTTGIGSLFQPVVDGTTMPVHPHDAVASGHAADVTLLAGTNLDETTLWLIFDPSLQDDEDALLRRFESLVPGEVDPTPILEVYRQRRPDAGLIELWSRALTDAIFRLPTISLIESQLVHQLDTFLYLFTWGTPTFGSRLGSCHGLELPFVFDNLDTREGLVLTGPASDDMRALAATMADAWVAFAHDGKPGWDRYELNRRTTMVFDLACNAVDDPHGEERAAWLAHHK